MENGSAPATKNDIEKLRSGTQQDIALLRSETKQDIALLRSETKQDITLLRSETKQDIALLRSETNHQYNDLVERITDSETRLLKAFYGFAESNNKRVIELEGNQGAVLSRLATIEGRLLQVEKRLNMPPMQ